MRAVCFHGRRERGGGGDFLRAARLLGAAAAAAGLSIQVRTPMRPAPPGAPDRALLRIAPDPLADLDLPRRYHIEVVADPLLAKVPPMGNALLAGGLLLLNAPGPAPAPPEAGFRVLSADLGDIAARRGASLAFPLAGAAWAAVGRIAPGWGVEAGHLREAAAEAGEDVEQEDPTGPEAAVEAFSRIGATLARMGE